MGRERNVSVYHHTMIMIVILRVHCVVRIMGIVATQCELLPCLMHLFEKKCVSMLGITRTDENCCHGRETNTFFFQENELLPCLVHLGYGMVIPSIHALGKAEHG